MKFSNAKILFVLLSVPNHISSLQLVMNCIRILSTHIATNLQSKQHLHNTTFIL